MKLSIWPGMSQPWADIVSIAEFADAGGWHALYVEDHFFDPELPADPLHEVTSAVGALAAVTSRIRLATLVLSVTHRHPAVIANWASTVDHISNGRFTLGLGAGWAVDEHTAYGLSLGTPAERVARFAEAVEIIDGLLRGGPVTIHGAYYDVEQAIAPPVPVQRHLPLLVGAKGPRMLALTARYAEEWNTWASPSTLVERMAVLDRACERADRDPRGVARSTQALVKVTSSAREAQDFVEACGPRPAVAGTPAHIAEQLAEYAEVGADEFIVPTWELGTGSELADHLAALWSATEELR